jgi:FixJ family two-component response regulator
VSQLYLTLLDPDSRRRAETTFALSQHNIRIDPFERLSELLPSATRATAFLIFDCPSVIAGLLNWMGDMNVWRPVIAYAHAPTIARIVRAINEGANDYLSWPISVPKLQYSIDRVSGLRDSPGEQRARRRYAWGRICVLSSRERQTLILVARGYSNRLIGEHLDISRRTVEIHRANSVRKLGVESTAEAILILFQAGVADNAMFDPVCTERRDAGSLECHDI